MSHFCMYIQQPINQNNDNIHITNLPQSNNDQNTSVEDTPQQKKIKQNILLNQAILFLDYVKILMFALALYYTNPELSEEVFSLFTWCKQVAVLACFEGCLKIWIIENENKILKGINRRKQQSIQLLDESLTAALTQPAISVESTELEEIEILELFNNPSILKTKSYLKQLFLKIENILTILINLSHLILFIFGNMIIYNKTDLNTTFIYKTTSVYLLIVIYNSLNISQLPELSKLHS